MNLAAELKTETEEMTAKTVEVSAPPENSRFVSDVLKLVSGTVLAQVVSVLASPLLARLFSPSAFGVFAVFTSITAVMSIVVCLRYDRSIIVPEEDEEAVNLLAVSLACIFLVVGASVVILLLGKNYLVRELQVPGLHRILWLVPVNVFFQGLLAALNTWNTRKRHFGLITVTQIVSSAGYVGLAVAAGLTGHVTGESLILAAFIGFAVSAIMVVVAGWRECRPVLMKMVNLMRMREVLYRYQRFPRYSTGAAILNSVSWELPTFFLSGFFSTMVVGQYALGNRLIRIPMSLLGTNISRVFSQRAAEAKYDGTLAPLLEKTFQSLVTMGMFPFLMLTLVGRELFTVIFGARWSEAGVYTEILSLWAFFWFVSAPLGSMLDILEEQGFDLRINIVILATRVVSLLIGGLLGRPRLALALFSASGVLVYGYYNFAVLKKCGVPYKAPIRMLLSHLVSFLPYGVVVVAAKIAGLRPGWVFALSVFLMLVYYANVIRTDSEARDMIYAFARKPFLKKTAAVG
jgi:lipopolysaccharide exporter